MKAKNWDIKGVTLWIRPAEISDVEKMNFEYSSTNFDEESLDLQLKFENPEYISSLPMDQDHLIIELFNFRDTNGDLIT